MERLVLSHYYQETREESEKERDETQERRYGGRQRDLYMQ
jgi:hypothetical protein